MRQRAMLGYAAGGLMVVALEVAAVAKWQGWWPGKPEHQARQQSRQLTTEAQALQARPLTVEPAKVESRPEDRHYAQLRRKLRWTETRMAGETLLTPDLPSSMLLSKSAARRAGLHEVGLGFEDVYGLINAETSWVPRTGASKDGTPNLGVAQFEPATAQALGLRDPHDVVEAVHVAAVHMKEAAQWSAVRITGLKLDREAYAARLREGVSIYYNLSSRGRAAWNGKNTNTLPVQTHHHIRNARLGAQQAAFLDAQLAALQREWPSGEAVLTAQAKPGAD